MIHFATLSFRHIFKTKKSDDDDDDKAPPYFRLKEEKQYSDLQFKEPPAKVPTHAIALAIVLFLLGSVMITLGALMLTGYINTQVRLSNKFVQK